MMTKKQKESYATEMDKQPNLIDINKIPTIRKGKVCPRCKEYKDEGEFYPSNRNVDGLTTYCKNCYSEMQKEKNKLKPNGWHYKKYGRDWYENNKDHELNRALVRRYGLTLEEKKKILISQGMKCPICGKRLSLYGRGTALDHNHETMKIRGVLCSKCNAMLGFARDNPGILERAIKYLEDCKVTYDD